MKADLGQADRRDIARMLDYSILQKDAQWEAIRQGCAETREYGFAAFYTSSAYWTPLVARELAGRNDVEIGTGIAFPLGSATAAVKAFETEDAVRRGCTAVDLVMNIAALKDRRYQVVEKELEQFVAAAGAAVTKCILEVCFLTDEEIATACQMVAAASIQFAKTSSGQYEGPSMQQFLVMRDALQDAPVRLKVAGIKFPRPQNAYAFLLAGADRLGTRAAPEIVDALDMIRQIGMLDGRIPTEAAGGVAS